MSIALPDWFRQQVPGRRAGEVSRLIKRYGLHTVCREAACPNSGHCFEASCLTFMILGNVCTRNCKFCNVGTAYYAVPAKTHRGGFKTRSCNSPAAGQGESGRIAELAARLWLDYVVVTSVTRDDLTDGGAEAFSMATEALHRIKSKPKVELLIPDFKGDISLVEKALSPAPDVAAHNLETVNRLYRLLRPQAEYRRSLGILKAVKKIYPGMISKSSLMLGLGEKIPEVIEAMRDLRSYDCDCLVLGQYLAPSARHYPVQEFITPGQFEDYRKIALDLGFKSVLSRPIARASYRARELYIQAIRGGECMN